ncbi:hypothetical protein X777_14630 [Ooceraea biroi]|uniref:Uncharacterized protein n=1 Tax=Ooceraea biroi TaxID=2015173 RepID=A0A026WZR8_OOCBI|nr:hypothetical protein X777_14630 [Ooceraea biroi]
MRTSETRPVLLFLSPGDVFVFGREITLPVGPIVRGQYRNIDLGVLPSRWATLVAQQLREFAAHEWQRCDDSLRAANVGLAGTTSMSQHPCAQKYIEMQSPTLTHSARDIPCTLFRRVRNASPPIKFHPHFCSSACALQGKARENNRRANCTSAQFWVCPYGVDEANEAVVPDGWPLTLGGNGLILQLGELETSALRLGECYLCVRSAAAATAIATATTSSVSGAGEATERNTVEIAVVWRATSMRAPGILGWDREDEFMDWRDLTNKGQPSSSSAAGTSLGGQSSASAMKISGRPRRRSREDARPRTREANRTGSAEHRREETRSIDRLEHQSCREDRVATEPGSAVMKSRSASSVNAWKEDLDDELERGASRRHAYIKNSSSSPVAGDESRTKVKRCAKVVSSTTMEKWKESSRCETRSRTVAPEDLKSPLQFEESVLRQDNATAGDSPKDLEDRLRHVGGPDDVSDEDLPAYIGNLLVTVERKIERVSLDDMTFPCPACRNIDTDDPLLGCRCAGDDCGCDAGEDNCDCAVAASRKEQSAWSFEVAGIKHIDSDDEEEVRMGFGE